MNRTCRIALCSLLATVSIVSTARTQGLPGPPAITVDPVLVGSPLGLMIHQFGDPGFPGFDVVVRDLNNNPVPGSFVSIEFGGTGLVLYSSQNAGTTVDCVQRSIHQVTNAQGRVTFAAQMGGWQDANLVSVQVDGVEVARVKARSMDYGGDGRVGIADLDLFASDFIKQELALRSDFDVSGSTGLGDFSIFSVHYLGSTTQRPLCP